MRRENALHFASRCGGNHVAEWLIFRWTPKATRFPTTQIILHTTFDRFAKDQPWLPHRSWHHTHFRKFSVRRFRAVAATHRHGQPDDFAAPFESCACYCVRNHERKQRIRSNENVRTRNNNRKEQARPREKEPLQVTDVIARKNSETRERRAFIAIE